MARQNKNNREIARQAKAKADETALYQTITYQHQKISAGPIPPPEMLHAYEAAFPGSVDIILRMAEDEAKHRRHLESTSIQAQATDVKAQRLEVRIGQVGAMLVAAMALLCGSYTAVHGSPVVGGAIGGGTVISLVGAFLYRQKASMAGQSPEVVDKEIEVPSPYEKIEPNATKGLPSPGDNSQEPPVARA